MGEGQGEGEERYEYQGDKPDRGYILLLVYVTAKPTSVRFLPWLMSIEEECPRIEFPGRFFDQDVEIDEIDFDDLFSRW